MNDAPRYVSLADYLRVARERRWLVIVITLLFTVSAVAYSVKAPPDYRAEATVEFDSVNQSSSLFGINEDTGGQTPDQRAAAAAEQVTSPEVLDRAASKLSKQLKKTVLSGDIARFVSAQPEARTQLVVVQATNRNRTLAEQIANATAHAASDVYIDGARAQFKTAADAQKNVLASLPKTPASRLAYIEIQQQIAKLQQLAKGASPSSVQREATNASATGPGRATITLLGLLVGLTLGLVGAFARDSLDRRFKTTREIADDLQLPILGAVPEDVLGRSLVGKRRWRAFADSDLEGFRVIRTNLDFLDVDHPPRLIVVTSALPEEGKSTVSAALAAAYATAGQRTLLVEADLRRPTLADRLDIAVSPGLSDYLVGNATPPEVLQTVAFPPEASSDGSIADVEGAAVPLPLVAISAGSRAPHPAELLSSKRFHSFFEQVKEVYDTIIVDSSPLLAVADTLEILPLSDAVVVCVRASQTRREQARAARGALAHLPERPAGVVITGIRSAEEGAYYGFYSYGKVYGATAR